MNSYRITYRFYDGMPVRIFLPAKNYRDAFDKAHKYITPYDGCQFIEPERVTKEYMRKKNVTYVPDNWKVRDELCKRWN